MPRAGVSPKRAWTRSTRSPRSPHAAAACPRHRCRSRNRTRTRRACSSTPPAAPERRRVPCYTERMLRDLWLGMTPTEDDLPTVGINYMPMSHVAGRLVPVQHPRPGRDLVLHRQERLTTLFEDMSLARPTQLLLVPRICDMLHQEFQSRLAARAVEGTDPAGAGDSVKTDLRKRLLGGRVRRRSPAPAPRWPRNSSSSWSPALTSRSWTARVDRDGQGHDRVAYSVRR